MMEVEMNDIADRLDDDLLREKKESDTPDVVVHNGDPLDEKKESAEHDDANQLGSIEDALTQTQYPIKRIEQLACGHIGRKHLFAPYCFSEKCNTCRAERGVHYRILFEVRDEWSLGAQIADHYAYNCAIESLDATIVPRVNNIREARGNMRREAFLLIGTWVACVCIAIAILCIGVKPIQAQCLNRNDFLYCDTIHAMTGYYVGLSTVALLWFITMTLQFRAKDHIVYRIFLWVSTLGHLTTMYTIVIHTLGVGDAYCTHTGELYVCAAALQTQENLVIWWLLNIWYCLCLVYFILFIQLYLTTATLMTRVKEFGGKF